MKHFSLLCFFFPLLFLSCGETPAVTSSETPRSATVHLKQRSSVQLNSLVPGLSLKISDITHDQTMLTLEKDGNTVLSTSIRVNRPIEVLVEGKPISITCNRLNNYLIGEDSGDFTITIGEKNTAKRLAVRKKDQE
jgi:hypothetical protein